MSPIAARPLSRPRSAPIPLPAGLARAVRSGLATVASVAGIVALLASLLPATPAPADPGLTGAAPTSAAATGQAPADGAADPQVRWYREVEPALAAAEASGRLVLVDLYADWCGWCKQLDVEFKTRHFRRWAQDYVLLRVDVEDGGEGTELKQHLRVSALPTTALMDHDKVRVGLLPGFKPANILTRELDTKVAAYEQLRRDLDRRGASTDRKARLAAADELRGLHAGRAAAQIYRSVLSDDGLDAATRARVGAALTDAWLMAGDLDAADASLAAARRAVVQVDEESRFRTQRLLDNLSLRVIQEREDCQQVAELETFLAERPSSTYVGQVERRLNDLKTSATGCS